MIDYIVVGLGLSGISFCHQLQKQQHSFVVIDNGKQSASRVGRVYSIPLPSSAPNRHGWAIN